MQSIVSRPCVASIGLKYYTDIVRNILSIEQLDLPWCGTSLIIKSLFKVFVDDIIPMYGANAFYATTIDPNNVSCVYMSCAYHIHSFHGLQKSNLCLSYFDYIYS